MDAPKHSIDNNGKDRKAQVDHSIEFLQEKNIFKFRKLKPKKKKSKLPSIICVLNIQIDCLKWKFPLFNHQHLTNQLTTKTETDTKKTKKNTKNLS